MLFIPFYYLCLCIMVLSLDGSWHIISVHDKNKKILFVAWVIELILLHPSNDLDRSQISSSLGVRRHVQDFASMNACHSYVCLEVKDVCPQAIFKGLKIEFKVPWHIWYQNFHFRFKQFKWKSPLNVLNPNTCNSM